VRGDPIIIEGNHEATHYANLYREAHAAEAELRRCYGRMLDGVNAIMTTIENKDSPVYVLLSAVVAASKWDSVNR
jgi:hypothetical protein